MTISYSERDTYNRLITLNDSTWEINHNSGNQEWRHHASSYMMNEITVIRDQLSKIRIAIISDGWTLYPMIASVISTACPFYSHFRQAILIWIGRQEGKCWTKMEERLNVRCGMMWSKCHNKITEYYYVVVENVVNFDWSEMREIFIVCKQIGVSIKHQFFSLFSWDNPTQ